MRREIFERDARPRELLYERGVFHERRDDHDLHVGVRLEQAVDESAAEDVARRHAARDGDEDVHAGTSRCSNSYGSDTRPSCSSASMSTPLPWPTTANRGPAVTWSYDAS